MQLSEYQWSGNPRGFHNVGAYYPTNYNRILTLHLGWYKFVCGGEEFAQDCSWLISNNVTPVIRIYRSTPGAEPIDDGLKNLWRIYRNAGALWFEFYNEPNLPDPEWPGDQRAFVDHRNYDGVIRPLCDNWLDFAEFIIGIGGYPGFPSLSETVGESGAIQWLDTMLDYMKNAHRERFQNVINNGLWASVHPYTLNHFYQEVPGAPSVPRPPEAQNALEGGWHFEYPYDPYTQSFDPGRTVFGSPSAPLGDPSGLIAMGTAFNERLRQWFDSGPVPAVGTEGGIYPLPANGESKQEDPRFPPYTPTSHGEATAAMFNWMKMFGPEWLLGLCLWKEDDYFNYQLPAVQRLIDVPQLNRDGTPMFGGGLGFQKATGPGPMTGDPTHHMVILAPGLDPDWFFENARAYWNTYRPIVTSAWNIIEFIPYEQSLAATIIAPPDMVDSMRAAIQERYPNVFFDLIIAGGDMGYIAEIFNSRVWGNRRFG